MGYWDWKMQGDGNPRLTALRKSLKGKKINEMTKLEKLCFQNDLAKRKEALERKAAQLKHEDERAKEDYYHSLGL